MPSANHTPATFNGQWLFPLLGGLLLLCVSGLLLYLVGYFFHGAVIAGSPASAYATTPSNTMLSPSLEQDLIILSATLRDLWWQQGFFIYLALFLLCFSLTFLAQGRGLILAIITALVLFILLWRLQGNALVPNWVTASIALAGIVNLLGAALVYWRWRMHLAFVFFKQHEKDVAMWRRLLAVAFFKRHLEDAATRSEPEQNTQVPDAEALPQIDQTPGRATQALWTRLQPLKQRWQRQPVPAPRLPPRLWTAQGLRDDLHSVSSHKPRHPYWQALLGKAQRLRAQLATVDWVDWALLSLALLSILGLIGVLTLAARF